jgi:hypothetical protein
MQFSHGEAISYRCANHVRVAQNSDCGQSPVIFRILGKFDLLEFDEN